MLRDWERLWLQESDYKNHRIFTLRCLHKDLVAVSIKLKSTLKTGRAKKIVRRAEKDLIQARIKSINNILDNIAKQSEECRSQLVSIISTERLRECQGFVDKVGEIKFNKVKRRPIKKFQNLVNKKEGNITWSYNNNNNLLQAGNNPVANRQAGAHLPPGEGSISSQPNTSQATALLPTGEGSSSPQATALPPREPSSISQVTALLPTREGSSSSQSNTSQVTALLPSGEGSSSSQATALPPGEASSISPATALLPGEGSSSSQAVAHLPSKGSRGRKQFFPGSPSSREGSNSSQATAHLPPGEGGSPPKQVN